MRQIVNMRTCIPGELTFGSREERLDYECLVATTRRQQRVPYAVAPRVTLRTPKGVIEEGKQVLLEHFEGATFATVGSDGARLEVPISAQRALADAVFDGLVIEAADGIDEVHHATTVTSSKRKA